MHDEVDIAYVDSPDEAVAFLLEHPPLPKG
jgi:hypothetical protein